MRRACLALALLGLSACWVTNPHFADSESDDASASVSASATGSAGAPVTSSGTTDSGTMGQSGGADTCVADAACDDGLFCTGEERCLPRAPNADAAGCVIGVAPCDPGLICDEATDACLDACQADPDADDDGVPAIACGGADCDDTDPDIKPGAVEVCDPAGVDEDCDPATLASADQDADGLAGFACCNLVMGELECGLDCDDTQPGFGVGDWAHCGACGNKCGVQQACIAGACAAARRVFVTSEAYTGNLGGLGGADAQCQARADAAGLGGAFKALLVDTQQGYGRFVPTNERFVRLDGVVVANSWSDLLDGAILAPLRVTEKRAQIGGGSWTGAWFQGVMSCSGWTSTMTCDGRNVLDHQCGGGGVVDATDDLWDGGYVYSCFDQRHLYCVEQ